MSSSSRALAVASALAVALVAGAALAQDAASDEWQAVEKPSVQPKSVPEAPPETAPATETEVAPGEAAAEAAAAEESEATAEAAEEAAEEPAEETAEADAEADEEEEGESGWSEYGSSVGNRYLVGLNSLITFPADPVMDTVKPREEFDELPLAAGTKYVAGFVTGTMLSVYRAGMGAFDLLCAPLTPMKMLSPEPRYMLFPNAQHEEY